MVEVDRQQRATRSIALRPRQLSRQLLLETAPVKQAGERVVVREVLELPLKALALTDIPSDRRCRYDGAAGIVDRRDGQRHRHSAAILSDTHRLVLVDRPA